MSLLFWDDQRVSGRVVIVIGDNSSSGKVIIKDTAPEFYFRYWVNKSGYSLGHLVASP